MGQCGWVGGMRTAAVCTQVPLRPCCLPVRARAPLQRFEAAIVAAGLPVVPRATMEGFHVTIGTTNSSFPMQAALAAINAAIPVWTPPLLISGFTFFFPPHLVKATP